MQSVTLVVVIPVGPNLRYDFITDTLQSIAHYTQSEYAVVIVDDSASDVGALLKADFPGIHVLKTAGQQGILGGLYFGTSIAFQYVLDTFAFQVLLRLDTDALVIGPGAELDAVTHFAAHPEIGLLGSYRVGSDGNTRDFSPPRRRLQREMNPVRAFLAPQYRAPMRFLQQTVRVARTYGYELGEHCLAAATFFRFECVRMLAQRQLLGREEFRGSRLGDDHLFGLLTFAAGYKIGDFATGNYPIAVRWRGLPFSPAELLERRKKITHSTRYWEELDEDAIRAFFRTARMAEEPPSSNA